jgi:uncharacterized protein with HEPN domain
VPREWKFRVSDIISAIESILKYIDGMDFNQFEQDQKTIDAVLKNLEVIGEAARHIPSSIKDKHSEIPWIEITGMRNMIVHEYFGISHKIV